MTITPSQLKEIRQEFAKLKPATVTLDGNRAMTVKQAIFTRPDAGADEEARLRYSGDCRTPARERD